MTTTLINAQSLQKGNIILIRKPNGNPSAGGGLKLVKVVDEPSLINGKIRFTGDKMLTAFYNAKGEQGKCYDFDVTDNIEISKNSI